MKVWWWWKSKWRREERKKSVSDELRDWIRSPQFVVSWIEPQERQNWGRKEEREKEREEWQVVGEDGSRGWRRCLVLIPSFSPLSNAIQGHILNGILNLFLQKLTTASSLKFYSSPSFSSTSCQLHSQTISLHNYLETLKPQWGSKKFGNKLITIFTIVIPLLSPHQLASPWNSYRHQSSFWSLYQ